MTNHFRRRRHSRWFPVLAGGLGPALSLVLVSPTGRRQNFYTYVKDDRIRSFPYLPNSEVANALMVGTQNMFLTEATPEEVVADRQKAVGAK